MPVNVNKIEPDEKIVEIEMERLREFRNHPFKVNADAQMLQLIESISKYGILNPLIVRPLPEGVYEIIAGHRRKYAAQHLGFRKMPVIIRVLRDDDAVINMVDSNLFRESIRPSEKAFAHKMKYELRPGTDWIAFLRSVDRCTGEVEYEGRDGDRLNLKRQLSKYLFLTVKPNEAILAGSRIHCSAEDGTVLSEFIVIAE